MIYVKENLNVAKTGAQLCESGSGQVLYDTCMC